MISESLLFKRAPTPFWRYFGAIWLAFLVHGLPFLLTKEPLQKQAERVPRSVRVVSLEVAAISTVPQSEKKERSQNVSAAPFEHAGTDGSTAHVTNRYSDLLPSNASSVFSEDPSTDSSKGSTSEIRGRKLPPAEQVPADLWSSHIVIPVRWRTKFEDAKAVARIAIENDESVWMRALNGEPMLRAILFDALLRPDFKPYILKYLRATNRREIVIVLRFIQTTGSYKTLNNEAEAFEDGMIISKTLPPFMRQFSGFALDDEHAKRSRKREELELAQFMESAAFARPLTDRRM